MPRLWVLSDLHHEFHAAPPAMTVPDADICVCAGDVLNKGVARAMGYLAEQVAPHMPVVFVPGNHEFYKSSLVEGMHEARALRLPGVHLLDDSAVVLDGVRFVGGTLWTDMELGGGRAWNVNAAEGLMNDYKAISYQKRPWQRLKAVDLVALHHETRRNIDMYLSVPFDGPTVVVTHHAPHPASIHERFTGSALNAAYASDLTDLIERRKPDLWVHGHMHDAADYMVGDTRIVCNPAGYPDEKTGYDPALVIEV
jgi:Icc-related predicted phosphoesterase